MASLAANRALRSSTAGSSPAIHLGSFSRMDIADFDSKGRYPTTPSPQDVRSVPVIAPAWAPIDPNGTQNAYSHQENTSGDRFQQGGPSGLSNGAGPYDNASMPRSTGEDAQRKNSGDSAGSNAMPVGPGPGTPSQRPYVDVSLQDPARASLPPGPRHPQAPSRASTISQNAQLTPQAGRPTGQYPYTPATTVTPTPGNQQTQTRQPDADPYNTFGATTLQVQNAPRAQMPPPPEEVCIECMMRDRDMADVIVTGPGIWDRDSDVHLRDLLEREDQEEMAWRERHAAELAVPGNKLRPPRRASKGHRLTEQNLKIWLTLNPKEAHARLMTIDAYVKQQAALLVEEAEARAKAQQDAQRFDARVRDNYPQTRHSTYEPSSTGIASEDSASGARIPPPRSSMYEALPAGQKDHKRDTIILDSGMIVERVNLKREEKERLREQKKARKASQATDISTLSPGGYASPATPTPNGMDSDFEPAYGNMSVTSLGGLRPKSAPLGVPIPKYASHASMDGKGHRFMGSKHWQAPWNSGASVAPSGSMMDMHVALDQEYDQQIEQFGAPPRLSNQHAMSSFSLPASPRNQSRPHTADAMMHSRRSTSPDPRAKKPSGFGKLWKMVRSKKSESKHHTSSVINYAREDDMSTPLPPPRVPYAASQRSAMSPHTRQASGPGSQPGYLPSPSHPRSISQSGGAISPTTAPSSSLPSPTSNRFPWRESTGDERRQSVYTKEVNGDAETLQGGSQMEPPQSVQYPEMSMQRPQPTGGSASSEYGRLLPPNSNGAPARSPAPSTAILSSSAHSPRPLSSIHKPLPLPPASPDTSARHTSMSFQGGANYAGARPSTGSGADMYAPSVPFREDGYDARRQSFSDALPPGAAQTLQPKRSIPAIAYNSGAQYADFGGQVDNYGLTPYSNGTLSDTSTKTKRRSRFLPFLSKKEKEKVPFAPQQLNGGFEGYEPAPLAPPSRPAFGHSQRSQSSVSLNTPEYAAGTHLGQPQQQLGYNDRARPMSGYSTFTNGQRPNKALIDQVVPRDNDFLAYRYPSVEQPSDVSRR